MIDAEFARSLLALVAIACTAIGAIAGLIGGYFLFRSKP
jgi:hypothetical protein